MSTDKIKEYYRVKAEINLDAIHENVANAKALTKPGTQLMAIIKADAYGHGAVMVAHTLEDVADAYGVAILEEGIELRQSGINKPILILGYTPAPLYPAMIKYDIATAVFEYDRKKTVLYGSGVEIIYNHQSIFFERTQKTVVFSEAFFIRILRKIIRKIHVCNILF